MRSSASHLNFLDFRVIAWITDLPFSSISIQVILPSTRFMVTCECSDRSSFVLYCVIDHYLSMINDCFNLLFGKLWYVFLWVDSCSEKDFVCVNITCSTDNFLVEDDHFGHSSFSVHNLSHVLNVKFQLVINLRPKFGNRPMLKLLPLIHKNHRPELPHIRIQQIRPIIQQELHMVMLSNLWLTLMEGVLAFHSKMRDDWGFVQFEDEVFAVPVDFLESLTDQFVDEKFGFWVLDDAWVVELDVLYLPLCWGQKAQGEESAYCLYLGELWHCRFVWKQYEGWC